MSVDAVVLLAFVPAALALNLTPGADMMFCLGVGLRSGRGAAVAASGGISVGAIVHVGLAGLGLSALITHFPSAFEAIRWIGVSYLLWLALSALRADVTPRKSRAVGVNKAFWQGLAVNLSNPKVILFVLAFVPQFIDPARGAVIAQFALLGSILALGSFVINGAVGVFAGSIGTHLTKNPKFLRILNVTSAGIFGALALRLALLQRT